MGVFIILTQSFPTSLATPSALLKLVLNRLAELPRGKATVTLGDYLCSNRHDAINVSDLRISLFACNIILFKLN